MTMLLFTWTLNAAAITTYPPGTSLENIAIAPNGDLFVTDLGAGTIFQISTAGSSRIFGQVPSHWPVSH